MTRRVMLDLETFGTNPHSLIIAAGLHDDEGLSWHYTISETELVEAFQECSFADGDTIFWHMKNLPSLQIPDYGSPRTLQDMADILSNYDEVWCYGAAFDFPIFRSATSWNNYRKQRCLRTVLAIKSMTLTPNNHNALDDARNQMQALKEALNLNP